MTGMLSKIDVLLGRSLPETLAELPLAAEVRLALCERDGDLGRLLQLCEACERVDEALIQRLCRSTGYSGIAGVVEAEAQAASWAIATTDALRTVSGGETPPRGRAAAAA
jgi:EAL and modified HD-GYP domain-containing signal transduction protein